MAELEMSVSYSTPLWTVLVPVMENGWLPHLMNKWLIEKLIILILVIPND